MRLCARGRGARQSFIQQTLSPCWVPSTVPGSVPEQREPPLSRSYSLDGGRRRPEAGLPAFRPQLHRLPAACRWAGALSLLGLSLPACMERRAQHPPFYSSYKGLGRGREQGTPTRALSVCSTSILHLPRGGFDPLCHDHTGGRPCPGHPLWLKGPLQTPSLPGHHSMSTALAAMRVTPRKLLLTLQSPTLCSSSPLSRA